MLLIYCLEIPIGRSAFQELRDRCKKAAANPDNEDFSFVERGTVQVYNLKLLMFKRALIVQTRMFKTTLAMKMVRLVDRETRATAN